MKNEKVILDTNLWINFLISKKFSQIDKLIKSRKIVLIFSNELLEEFIDIISRSKFKKYFSKKDIEKILEYFDLYGELVKVKSDIEICRDEKDNFLLNLSVDSKKDLLIIKKIENTKILTFSEFIERTE
ncbi:putative toxin-antitoxin system toxin component, PIN family [Galbibacter pacificus]|uniref:Toxin-antitoxin system toxin component, PIN family n=1 Tax=Galbibacter pacificus TaxID=2996052 RepID=A0ABT6FRB7_9FLAO|nr:putative toxin-antitoxin system toxin component, PIN family [Galbibacter pacificus]MDG3581859.1 putative toxin-antitoxin system toxin component, PIN family [Galbibacter pacificus]MDG3585667.1 putative toxin-antitoxin system toxin component, PIN family [Galbibacter pacificus]